MKYNGIEVKGYKVHSEQLGIVEFNNYESYEKFVKANIKNIKVETFEFSDDCFHAYMKY